MKRGLAVAVSVTVLAIIGIFLVDREYRMAVLTPAELAAKLPRVPKLPENCAEIRRAIALSARSLESGREKPAKITSPFDADETAIYREVIQRWNSSRRTGLNVSAQTFSLAQDSSSAGRECGCFSGLSAESLLKASHSFHVLTANDLPDGDIRLIDPGKQRAIVAENDPGTTIKETPVKEAVENGFANGLFSLSEIAFDKERQHAVVSYGYQCGMLCGNGAMWVFEKVDGKWKKSDGECGGWIS